MKNLIKKHSKIVLFVGVCLFSLEAFSASEATKRMIQDTLSKFCIPPKKENCNPREEGQYDPNYNFCLCEDDGMVYSKSGRKCVECGAGTYYRRNMKDNSCKSCSPGTYQDKEGQSSCKDCKAGSYSSGYGNTGCSSCWAGSFQPSSGQSTCKSCNSNNCETSGIGATSCYSKCGGSDVCSAGSCKTCGLSTSNWSLVFSSYQEGGKDFLYKYSTGYVSGNLEPGIFKVVVAAGPGGSGGGAHCIAGTSQSGGGGGAVGITTKIVHTTQASTYSGTIGEKGGDGSYNSGACGSRKGGAGGDGVNSVITVAGTRCVANGGKGGSGGYATLYKMFGGCYGCYNGSSGSAGWGEDLAKNNRDYGYLQIYKCY